MNQSFEAKVRNYLGDKIKSVIISHLTEILDEHIQIVMENEVCDSMGDCSFLIDELLPKISSIAGDDVDGMMKDINVKMYVDMDGWCEDISSLIKRHIDDNCFDIKNHVMELAQMIAPTYLIMLSTMLTGIEVNEAKRRIKNGT